MQYLLTEEEYNTLHGEGDVKMDGLEIDALEIELTHLKRDIRQFFHNANTIDISDDVSVIVPATAIPESIKQEMVSAFQECGHILKS